VSYDECNLQVSYPFQKYESPQFMIDYNTPCKYFQSGFVEDYDAWCWPFYIETKKAFPHIILTNPYFNLLNGTLASYIGTLGKALAFPNKTGSPA